MYDREHTLWVEKYRPDSLDNYIGNESMKQKFATYIANADIPHLLLVGPAGTGKTTAAKILIKSIDCDSMILNASDDNNIETVRTKIRSFVSTQSFSGYKIVLLDEFDGFTRAGQEALRNLMEQFSLACRFILTANYKERVIDPIQSRVQMFQVVPPSNKAVCIHLANIMKTEGFSYAAKDVKTLVNTFFPDIRKILNEAQLSVVDGRMTINQDELEANDFKAQLITMLPTGNITDIRQLLMDADIRDYSPVYRHLFDHVMTYADKNPSAAILAIAEGQYRDSSVVDKEINMMACLINLKNTI